MKSFTISDEYIALDGNELDENIEYIDFKYLKKETAQLYSKAPDYPEVAKKAIDKMVSMVGAPVFDDKTGLIKSGVIVRVLVLPERTNEAIDIIKYLYSAYYFNYYKISYEF